MEQVFVRTRLRRIYTLAPLLVLVVSACAQGGPQAYNGVQARTPVDKIPDGGQMKSSNGTTVQSRDQRRDTLKDAVNSLKDRSLIRAHPLQDSQTRRHEGRPRGRCED